MIIPFLAIGGIFGLVIYLIVLLLVFWLLYYLVNNLAPEPMRKIPQGAAQRRRGIRRLRPDGNLGRIVRAAVPRLRRCDRDRAQAAGVGRGRLSGAGAGRRDLPVLPNWTPDNVMI